LRCGYCYIGKRDATMSARTARAVVDWIFGVAPPGEKIDIGIFGGEPLLELPTVRTLAELVRGHAGHAADRVTLTVVSNGTLFTPAIAQLLQEHRIHYNLSCDGAAEVQDRFRHFQDGRGSSGVVERTARAALGVLGPFPVNAVYRPETLRRLPDTVDHLSLLGFRQIHLNPDFGAPWSRADVEALPAVYAAVAERYVASYHRKAPLFVSLIDSKITVLLRGGYQATEQCRMGEAEFAFSPEGDIFPCERLIGHGRDSPHRIGHVVTGLTRGRCGTGCGPGGPAECRSCGLRPYCMNWCGCSNFFSTGDYARVGPFLCASERAALSTAAQVLETLEDRLGPTFMAHLTGRPASLSAGAC
jgi:uncharacterized protein